MADKRVAFVVGNGAYRNAALLPNPPLDAEAMAALLRKVGFDVVEGIDLTRDAMTERLLEFSEKAKGADIAVFFYAGHGVAVNDTNYLLPIDADLKTEMDFRPGAAIDMDTVLDQTMGEAKVKLVFLDACRDNPFAARIKASGKRRVSVQSGLAEMKSGENTLIAFATGPGQTALDGTPGSDSPFTRALVDNITQPGVEIQQAMTKVRAQVNAETDKGQLPWGSTNLLGSVYLNPQGAPAIVVTKQTTVDFPEDRINGALEKPAPATPSDAELDLWRSIKDSKNPEELRAYLTAYPNGRFRYPALARIAYLEGTATKREVANGTDPETYTKQADQTSEDRIGLDRSERRDVQRRLTGLGFDTRINGKFDDDTRAVISRWQAARGYPITGYLNELQRKALLAETAAAPQASAGSDDGADHPARASRQRRHSSGEDDDVGHLFGSVVAGMTGTGGKGGGMYGRSRPGSSKRPPSESAAPDEPDVPPELGLPDLPWPPPAPSASYVLPDNLLAGRKTLQEATDAIVSALERTGYVERSFYRTKPGGIALVTHLERIKSDGSPAEPDRWAAVAGNYSSSADLMNFLRGLFFAKTGHYRLIVFIMQDTPFVPSAKAMAEPEARTLIRQGANVLPAETGKRSFAGNHCTALIYEFSSDGKSVDFMAESPLTGKEHLDKAGVLTLLAKPK